MALWEREHMTEPHGNFEDIQQQHKEIIRELERLKAIVRGDEEQDVEGLIKRVRKAEQKIENMKDVWDAQENRIEGILMVMRVLKWAVGLIGISGLMGIVSYFLQSIGGGGP